MTSNPYIKMNLQFFAKEGMGGEKTEKPTSKKRKEAREEGQVAKSNEIVTAASLVVFFSSLLFLGGYAFDRLTNLFYRTAKLFSFSETTDLQNPVLVTGLIGSAFQEIIVTVLPFMVLSVAVAIITNLVQVGWKPTLKPLKPKFSKLNPIKGFKNVFSLKAIIELIKSILKIIIIGFIIYTSITDEFTLITNMFDYEVSDILHTMIRIVTAVGIKVGGFYVIVAAIDYAYQKYKHEQELKMTKQEIKEEYKMQEGNPEVKGKMKQKMREISMRRMMQDLPKADVIITNPTHFAVAIQYDTNVSDAPRVIAKGADLVAKRIKEKARDYDIEIVENKPLARTLFYTVDIGFEIPPELYQTVAEVLAFVFSIKNKGV